MATKNPVKNTLYFGFSCSYFKNEGGDPHFLSLENNQHDALKLSAIFQKFKVAVDPLSRIFFKICRKFNCDMLVIFQQ